MISDAIYTAALAPAIALLRADGIEAEITRVSVSPMAAGAVVVLLTRNKKRRGHLQSYEYLYDKLTNTCTLDKEAL